MKIVHKILESSVIATFALCFAFVSVYVPHDFNKVDLAHAGAMTGNSTWMQQLVDTVIHISSNAGTTISASADSTSAAMEAASFSLDNVVDGIAWALAKNVLSEMTSSIVNWVNSGFKGSPAFITDMKGFLTDVADKQAGQYLQDLGGAFSFICSPFKLDVRLALAISLDQQRNHGTTPGTCTLSGALANIDRFIDGSDAFVSGGGWNNWFDITTQPSQYTPYGNLVTAQAEVSARIVNARGEELKLLEFGEGFLSSKICEDVSGAGGTRESCVISTPGKVINEALTFQTSAGPRSLIEADEINEIISAVFAQLTQKAITGAKGLLGLSGGTGYSYSGTPFTTQVAAAGPTSDPAQFRLAIDDALALENDYLSLTIYYEPRLLAYASNTSNPAAQRLDVAELAAEIPALQVQINNNITDLTILKGDFDTMMLTGVNPALLQDMTTYFYNHKTLHSEVMVDGSETTWKTYLKR